MRSSWNRWCGVAVLAVLLAAAAATAAPSGASAASGEAERTKPAGPAMHVEQTHVDLGRVPEGENATAEFVIVNRGTAELRILKAKAG